jgi:hypothetical protein
MKQEKVIALVDGPAKRQIVISWLAEDRLMLQCLSCTQADEITRRAPSYQGVTIQFLGFPKDEPFTNTQPVEK